MLKPCPGWKLLLVLVLLTSLATTFAEENTTVDIGGGVQMPRVNLGTCCGSDPRVGLSSWIEAGGVGVDSAWDYGNQANLSAMIKASGKPRSSFFITSKVPAGDHMPGTPGIPGACAANPNASLAYVRDSLKLLGVEQLDLVLIHSSCANYDPPVPDAAASDNALWQGLMQAKQQGLTRSIVRFLVIRLHSRGVLVEECGDQFALARSVG
jgi:diketogulonate reductase-like aldo/keto reductase